MQRALLQCYLGAGTYRAEWAVSTWLYRILTNVCVDELRRRKSRSGELEPPARPDPPDAHLDLRRALGGVPTEARVLLALRYVDGLSYGELARDPGHLDQHGEEPAPAGKSLLKSALVKGGAA